MRGRTLNTGPAPDWYTGGMETVITAALLADDLAELDRVCRRQRVDRAEAVHEALRWYIGREGDLPPLDDPATEFEP